MKNVSDLLKSESFREQQLHPFLMSKFKEGTIPTDKNEFLNCCSYDKDKYALKFCYKFGDFEHQQIELFFGTSKVNFDGWAGCYFKDERDIYVFVFDYLKIVVQQLDCIDRINRLISIAGTLAISNIAASVLWDGGSQENLVKTKYRELDHIAQERISWLEHKESLSDSEMSC